MHGLAHAEYHAILSAVWGSQAGLACAVFILWLSRERPWDAFMMRYQLAVALAAICFGDFVSGAIGSSFWINAYQHDPTFQQNMIFLLIPVRAVSACGYMIAIRAMTFSKYGNRLWLYFGGVSFAAGLFITWMMW